MSTTDARDGLNDMQRRFAAEYLVDFSPAAAYRRAGYRSTGKSAFNNAYRLLEKPSMKMFLAKQEEAILAKLEVSAEAVMNRLGAQALGDIRGLFDEHNALKPIHELNNEQQALIQGVEIIEFYVGTGDDRLAVGRTCKIKFIDRLAPVATLGKFFLAVQGKACP